jgi:hypothetical protein
MKRATKTTPSKEALALDRRLLRLKGDIRRRWLDLGEVLAEIQQTLAYRELGFWNFQQYVEDRLAISPRWANYLVCMVRKAKRFGISQETLAEVQVSKTMEIFRLDDPQKARDLVEKTVEKGTPLKEIKRQVAIALGEAEDGPQPVRKVWYFAESQWTVVSQAIKAVQMNTGSESETYAIELICADYLAGIGLDTESLQTKRQ